MKASLAKLVDVIRQHLEEHTESPPTEKGMRSWLAREGYKKGDIDEALKVMRSQFGGAHRVSERHPGSVRQLSNFESHKMTLEAKQALVRLELYELIAPYEREVLLERLSQYEGEVGIEDFDYLLSWVLCSTRDVESQQTVYAVMEGPQHTLH
jgi:uncharacterized protein Smg (DUF494 family)